MNTEPFHDLIIYVCPHRRRRVFTAYSESWGAPLRDCLRLVSYEQLFRMTELPCATYIFADLERLSAAERERAAAVWDLLQSAWPDCRLLNHPLRARRRFSLLRTLHKEGINAFDVYRAEEDRRPSRFPVFVRRENSHSKPLSDLLFSAGELAAVEQDLAGRIARDDTLITEFLNEPDPEGRFWKYSAFVFDGRIVPAHLFVENQWCVKAPALVDEGIVEAEYRFVSDNPHEEVLKRVARIARIDYGRIDYGVVRGAPQIYEINTHPRIMASNDAHFEQRVRARELSAGLIEEAFRTIDTTSDAGKSTPGLPGAIEAARGNKIWKRAARAVIRTIKPQADGGTA
jgi:hypothetical protein